MAGLCQNCGRGERDSKWKGIALAFWFRGQNTGARAECPIVSGFLECFAIGGGNYGSG